MSLRPVLSVLRLPRSGGAPPRATLWDATMEQLERADAANVKNGTTPALPGLILTAPDGSSWRVLVDAAGALSTERISRT
jgi:hypothetical protein